MPADPAKLLQKYRDEGYNILTPAITLDGLSERHKATVETLSLSPNPDYGDVYKDKNSKNGFIVKKQGLDKLAVLAGIETASRPYGPTDNPDYIAFECQGKLLKADGVEVGNRAYYDIDMIAMEDDLTHQYREKGSKGDYKKEGDELEEYVTYCVGRDMRQIRKHRATKCESGARNRVIRSLLGLKNKYTKQELTKPFVAVRITYQPDHDDPEVKKLLTLKSMGALADVFGERAPQMRIPGPVAYKEEAIVVDHTEETNGVITEDDDIPDDENEPPDHEDQFELWDRQSQDKHVTLKAKRKGYDLKSLLKRMERAELADLTDIEILKINDNLSEMPDKEVDDIPF